MKAGTVNIGEWFMLAKRHNDVTFGHAVEVTEATPLHTDRSLTLDGQPTRIWGRERQIVTWRGINGYTRHTTAKALWRRATPEQIELARRRRLELRLERCAALLRRALDEDGDLLQPGDLPLTAKCNTPRPDEVPR